MEDIFVYRENIPKENRFCFKTFKKNSKSISGEECKTEIKSTELIDTTDNTSVRINRSINTTINESNDSIEKKKFKRNLSSTKYLLNKSTQEQEDNYSVNNKSLYSHSTSDISPNSLERLCSKYSDVNSIVQSTSITDKSKYGSCLTSDLNASLNSETSSKNGDELIDYNSQSRIRNESINNVKNTSCLSEDYLLLEQEKEWLKDIDWENDTGVNSK